MNEITFHLFELYFKRRTSTVVKLFDYYFNAFDILLLAHNRTIIDIIKKKNKKNYINAN